LQIILAIGYYRKQVVVELIGTSWFVQESIRSVIPEQANLRFGLGIPVKKRMVGCQLTRIGSLSSMFSGIPRFAEQSSARSE
jgi:hypothetical protein